MVEVDIDTSLNVSELESNEHTPYPKQARLKSGRETGPPWTDSREHIRVAGRLDRVGNVVRDLQRQSIDSIFDRPNKRGNVLTH